MACGCKKEAPNGYTVTKSSGEKVAVSTKPEAIAMAGRTGGTYRPK